jgi:exonuclease VII large subunit
MNLCCALPLALWYGHAQGAELVDIRRILEDPRSFHLKQVALKGTVRNVSPLDPYKLPAGTTCYGAYLFYLEDETASINVAVFGQCGRPIVKDPDVEEGQKIELEATIQAPSHGGYYLSFQGVKVAGEREGVIQAVADRILPAQE